MLLTIFFATTYLLQHNVFTSPPPQAFPDEDSDEFVELGVPDGFVEIGIPDSFITERLSRLLYLDTIFAAAGGRLISVRNNDHEKEERVIALTSANLWLNLNFMLRMDEIYMNVSEYTARQLVNLTSFGIDFRIHQLYVNIEKTLLTDPVLRELYVHEKGKVQGMDLPLLGNDTVTIDVEHLEVPLPLDEIISKAFEIYPRTRLFAVNKRFIDWGAGRVHLKKKFQFYFTATMMMNAFNSTRRQEIYDQAIQITADEVDWMTIASKMEEMDDVLFGTIMKLCEMEFDWVHF